MQESQQYAGVFTFWLISKANELGVKRPSKQK